MPPRAAETPQNHLMRGAHRRQKTISARSVVRRASPDRGIRPQAGGGARKGETPVQWKHPNQMKPRKGDGMWSDSTTPNGGAIGSTRKWRMHAAGGTWRATDDVRHPFGVPRPRWFRLQGLRCRSTACLRSAAPPGFRRHDERVNVVPSGGRLSFPAEVDCRSLRRAIVVPCGGQVNLTR